LPPMLADVAQQLQYPKSMRWDAGDYRAGRPVRWLLALFGGDVVPVRAFGLAAGKTTFGHRFLHPGALTIKGADQYVDALRKAFVLADPDERRRAIEQQIGTAAAAQSGRIVADDELTDIVNYL